MKELYELIKEWPEAVDPELICDENSEEDKIQRAKNILSFFVQHPLEGKKVLDFGCGEGHLVVELSSKGSAAFGYDLVESGSFKWNDENSPLSTDLQKINSMGPFDAIILYDVIDHAKDMDECLLSVRNLCEKDTFVYVLTHPWCGRHGGHLYKKFNYAFAHILFEEMDSKVNKIVNPIITYEKLFERNNFEITHKEIVKDPVEDFFKQKLIKDKVLENFNSINKGFIDLPVFQMEQSFHEYVLRPK